MNKQQLLLQSTLSLVIAVAVSWWMAPEQEAMNAVNSAASLAEPLAEPDIIAISGQDPEFDKQVFIELARAQQARKQLDQRITQLKNSVAQLQRESSMPDSHTDSGASNISINTLSDAESETKDRSQILAQMGIASTRAEQIRKREEEQDLQRLFLRNRALREGWMGTERYFNESQKLDADSNIYLQELGADEYDRFLYLSGENNRVSVASVMAGSPAEKAGIISGDIILQYGNKPVFNWTDLTTATTEGNQGEEVTLRLQRNTGSLNVYLPRGPLGVRLDMTRIDPANNP